MHIVGFRYSLLSVVGAGVLLAVPLVGIIAVRTAQLDVVTALPAPDPAAGALHERTHPRQVPSLDELAGGAQLVPGFEQGQVVGIKIFGIRQGSFYERAGLHNGDVIHDVNGIALTTPERALDAFASFGVRDRVEIGFTRRGEPGRLTHLLD